MIDRRHLAYLAGVSLTESSFGKTEVKDINVWRAAVGKTAVRQISATVVEAFDHQRGVIGSYDSTARRGWVREDIFDMLDSEDEDDQHAADQEVPPEGEDDLPPADGEPEPVADQQPSTDDLIFVRQLEDLHSQCSSEVKEIIDHYKKDGQFGSRERVDVEGVLELYKQLYLALFADH
jgi:hypothetical protein